MRAGDRLVRLCGADPDVFHPMARAQAIRVRRRARLVRGEKGLLSKVTPFRLLCCFAMLYGFFGLFVVIEARASVLGAALALTLGCSFLLMVVVMDDLDVLVNPREYLVLAAHPHDDRSVILAKVFVVGRSLAILWALLFFLPAIGAGVQARSAAAGIAFLAGSAGAASGAATAAIFLGAVILAVGGRAAMQRLLPVLQVAFQLSYFLFLGGRQMLSWIAATEVPGWISWALPPFWFLAPFEATLRGLTLPLVVKTLLALAAIAALLAGGTRYLDARVGEKLLAPPQARRRALLSRPSRRRSRALAFFFRGEEERRLFDLLRVHLKSDWRIRSEFLMMPFVGLLVLLESSSGRQKSFFGPAALVSFFGWFLMLSVDVLTRSSRPASLWCLLVSPVDRARLSAASVSIVRVFQLLPLAAVLLAVQLLRAEGSLAERLLTFAQLVLFGDLLILVGRGLFPGFPFSRPARMEGESGGRRTLVVLMGATISAFGGFLLWLFGLAGLVGMALAVAMLLAVRRPAELWMRQRVGGAAESLELAAALAER